jgi:ketosteroid isomerase-like protein
MAENPNAVVAKQSAEAFAKADVAAHKAHYAADVVWHVPGKSSVAGDYHGIEAVFAYFDKLTTLLNEGKFQDLLMDTTASAQHAVNIHHLSGRRNGKTLDTMAVVIIQQREGKITEGWSLIYDQYAWDAYWS